MSKKFRGRQKEAIEQKEEPLGLTIDQHKMGKGKGKPRSTTSGDFKEQNSQKSRKRKVRNSYDTTKQSKQESTQHCKHFSVRLPRLEQRNKYLSPSDKAFLLGVASKQTSLRTSDQNMVEIIKDLKNESEKKKSSKIKVLKSYTNVETAKDDEEINSNVQSSLVKTEIMAKQESPNMKKNVSFSNKLVPVIPSHLDLKQDITNMCTPSQQPEIKEQATPIVATEPINNQPPILKSPYKTFTKTLTTTNILSTRTRSGRIEKMPKTLRSIEILPTRTRSGRIEKISTRTRSGKIEKMAKTSKCNQQNVKETEDTVKNRKYTKQELIKNPSQSSVKKHNVEVKLENLEIKSKYLSCSIKQDSNVEGILKSHGNTSTDDAPLIISNNGNASRGDRQNNKQLNNSRLEVVGLDKNNLVEETSTEDICLNEAVSEGFSCVDDNDAVKKMSVDVCCVDEDDLVEKPSIYSDEIGVVICVDDCNLVEEPSICLDETGGVSSVDEDEEMAVEVCCEVENDLVGKPSICSDITDKNSYVDEDDIVEEAYVGICHVDKETLVEKASVCSDDAKGISGVDEDDIVKEMSVEDCSVDEGKLVEEPSISSDETEELSCAEKDDIVKKMAVRVCSVDEHTLVDEPSICSDDIAGVSCVDKENLVGKMAVRGSCVDEDKLVEETYVCLDEIEVVRCVNKNDKIEEVAVEVYCESKDDIVDFVDEPSICSNETDKGTYVDEDVVVEKPSICSDVTGGVSSMDEDDKDDEMAVEICCDVEDDIVHLVEKPSICLDATGGVIHVDRDKLMEEPSICSDETEGVNFMDEDNQIKETFAKDTCLEEDFSVEEPSVGVRCVFEETAAEVACGDANDLFVVTSAMVSSKDKDNLIGKISTRANCEDRNDLVEVVQEKEEHSVLLKVIKPIFDEDCIKPELEEFEKMEEDEAEMDNTNAFENETEMVADLTPKDFAKNLEMGDVEKNDITSNEDNATLNAEEASLQKPEIGSKSDFEMSELWLGQSLEDYFSHTKINKPKTNMLVKTAVIQKPKSRKLWKTKKEQFSQIKKDKGSKLTFQQKIKRKDEQTMSKEMAELITKRNKQKKKKIKEKKEKRDETYQVNNNADKINGMKKQM